MNQHFLQALFAIAACLIQKRWNDLPALLINLIQDFGGVSGVQMQLELVQQASDDELFEAHQICCSADPEKFFPWDGTYFKKVLEIALQILPLILPLFRTEPTPVVPPAPVE